MPDATEDEHATVKQKRLESVEYLLLILVLLMMKCAAMHMCIIKIFFYKCYNSRKYMNFMNSGILKVEQNAQKDKSGQKRKVTTKGVDVERRTSKRKHEETTKCLDVTCKTKNKRIVKSRSSVKDIKDDNNDGDGSKKEVVSSIVNKKGSKKVTRASNWRSIRTRVSPHQLLVGLNTLSKQQLVAIKTMGFGSILKLKIDSLPAKMSHFVVDKFSGKDMAIKFNVGNIEVNETVISELLGLRNSGAVIEYKKKEKEKDKENEEQKEHKDKQKGKKNDKNNGPVIESDVKEDEDEEEEEEDEEDGILAEWNSLYKGRTLTPSRIVERLRDNPTEDGIMFKYDFLTLFMNTMVETNKDGRCKTDFLECLGEDVAVEDVNWCKYICDSIKMSKDGWQRDSTSKYFNGALTILVMLYVDRTLCGDINTVRTSSPLSFWTKEMLSRR
ncbi:hypothetical protein Hanom_Chr11g01001611 [Helianthus anomalus]